MLGLLACGLRRFAGAPVAEFSPEVRQALRVDIPAALLFTVFTCLTTPFTGLILRRDLGATPLQLAIAPAAGAVCLLLSLLWARLVAGRAPLPYVVWPAFAARGLFILVPLLPSAGCFVALLVAGHALTAMSGPAQAALVQGLYPRAQRGRALGLVKMAGALPGIALIVGAGQLLAVADYRWVFPIAALLGMAAALHQRHLPWPGTSAEPHHPARPGLREAWAAVRGDAAFRRLLLGSSLFGVGIWIQMPATPVLLADVLGVGTAEVGAFAAAAAVAALAGNGAWGRLVDRRGSLAALRAVYTIGAAGPLLYWLAGTPWIAGAAAVVESLTHTGLDVVWTLAVIDAARPRRVTQYVAIAGTLAGVRGVLGPLLGALVVGHVGVHAVYLLAALTMGLAALVLGRQLRAGVRAARLAPRPAGPA